MPRFRLSLLGTTDGARLAALLIGTADEVGAAAWDINCVLRCGESEGGARIPAAVVAKVGPRVVAFFFGLGDAIISCPSSSGTRLRFSF